MGLAKDILNQLHEAIRWDFNKFIGSHGKKPNMNLSAPWILKVNGKELEYKGKLKDFKKTSDMKEPIEIVVLP